MRILRILPTLDPAYGGPVEGVVRTTPVLAALGHQTTIATLDVPRATFLQSAPATALALGSGVSVMAGAARLAHWLDGAAREFDIAVLHGLWHPSGLGGWNGLRRAGLPFAVFTHGMLDPWFTETQPIKGWAKRLYWTAFQQRILAEAGLVLFTSPEELRRARQAFPCADFRARVVSYGAGEPPIASAPGGSFRTRMPVLRGREYLLFLGRLHPKKGCDLLLDGFAHIAAIYPGLDLVIAGPDQVGIRAALMGQADRLGISSRVHWPGLLLGAEKWDALKGAQAFVLPSHQENFGIAVAEAMACGVPVLISDKVNIADVIAQTGAGMVGPDSTEGVQGLLKAFLALSPVRQAEMGERARVAFVRHFTIERAASDLADALGTCMEGTMPHG